MTLTLPSASTPGTLLVATASCDSGTSTFTASASFAQAVRTGTGSTCAAIFYLASNPGGISGVTLTSSNASIVVGQLTEWSGPTALDVTGVATTLLLSLTLTVAPSGALAGAGELAVTVFGQNTAAPSAISYTPESGWTNLGQTGNVSGTHYSADYRLGVGPGLISEVQTSSIKASWSGVIAAFR